MVRNALGEIVGKRITAVVVKKGGGSGWQLHLVFDDDTCYEIYRDGHLGTAGGLDRGGLEEARRYGRDGDEIVFEVVLDDAEMGGGDVN